MQRRTGLESARAAQSALQQRAVEAEAALATARGDLEKTTARLAATSVQLEPADRINRRVDDITALAGQARLSLSQTSQGAASPAAQFITRPIRLEGTGAFSDCVSFLGSLLRGHRDIAVTGLRMTGAGGPDKAGTAFTFDLVWYAAPAGSAAASAEK
jgi:hypothetical protein